MAEEKKFIKRTPAKNVRINELTRDLDRVAVLGTVVAKDDSVFSVVMDDSTDKVNAILNSEEEYDKISTGQIVRIIGKIWGEGPDVEIQAEIVQDFTGIDVELYNEVLLKKSL